VVVLDDLECLELRDHLDLQVNLARLCRCQLPSQERRDQVEVEQARKKKVVRLSRGTTETGIKDSRGL